MTYCGIALLLLCAADAWRDFSLSVRIFLTVKRFHRYSCSVHSVLVLSSKGLIGSVAHLKAQSGKKWELDEWKNNKWSLRCFRWPSCWQRLDIIAALAVYFDSAQKVVFQWKCGVSDSNLWPLFPINTSYSCYSLLSYRKTTQQLCWHFQTHSFAFRIDQWHISCSTFLECRWMQMCLCTARKDESCLK